MRFRYAFGYSTQARIERISADLFPSRHYPRRSAASAQSAFYFTGQKIYAWTALSVIDLGV
jgi:hypothetical protein